MNCLHGGEMKAVFDTPIGRDFDGRTSAQLFVPDGIGISASVKYNDNGRMYFQLSDKAKTRLNDSTFFIGYDRLTCADPDDILSITEIDAVVAAMEQNSETEDEFSEGPIPAAYTYFGQFIAHDISQISLLEDGTTIDNLRSAELDLDGILSGSKPTTAEFGTFDDEADVLVGKTLDDENSYDDLPRNKYGRAAIPDLRNDSNLALAQMHVAIAKYHKMIWRESKKTAESKSKKSIQEIALFDFLYRVIDRNVWWEVIKHGRGFIWPEGLPSNEKFLIPIEFSAACFRFGHSMVRPEYDWNVHENASVSDLLENTNSRLEKIWTINWSKMLKQDGAGSLNLRLASKLFKLNENLFEDPNLRYPVSLARQTLVRARLMELPSAQTLANHIQQMGNLSENHTAPKVLAPEEVAEVMHFCFNHGSIDVGDMGRVLERTPLWIYTLIEAQSFHCGERLGPLASRIVMETIHASIEASGTGIVTDNKLNLPIPRDEGDFSNYLSIEKLIAISESWKPAKLLQGSK